MLDGSQPFLSAKIIEGQCGGHDRQADGEDIAVPPFQLGHVLEVHSVPGPDDHQWRGDDGDEGEKLYHLAGLIGRNVQINLEDVGQ